MPGVDDGLKNIELFAQDYPEFEIIFVSDLADDPAFGVIEEARQAFQKQTGPVISTIIAGPATDSGQKVHNLRKAINAADPQSEVFVFTDTDAQTQKFWLRALVAPLRDETVGATTGYRWFVARDGGFASHLLSGWNAAIASALGERGEKNFCWGGSTAITARRLKVYTSRIVEGTVSDDFTVTRVLHEAGRAVKLCRMPNAFFSSFGARELIEFTTRQLKITRAYASHLWRSVLIGSVIFA